MPVRSSDRDEQLERSRGAGGAVGFMPGLLAQQNYKTFPPGVVAEWLNAAVLKTAERETVP
jgi:hypothetical protein